MVGKPMQRGNAEECAGRCVQRRRFVQIGLNDLHSIAVGAETVAQRREHLCPSRRRRPLDPGNAREQAEGVTTGE